MPFTSSEIVFTCGRKGSGKSFWLNRYFVATQPRVIHIGATPELLHDPHVLPCYSYDELLVTLGAFATANQREWRVVVSLDNDADAIALFKLIAPTERFGQGGLAAAFGGLAIECGECDVWAPLHGTAPEISSAWRRSRHHGLNLGMGTQRATSCDITLRSMADVVAVFALDEPADLDWVERKMGRAAADEVAQLEEHWHVEKRQGESFVRVVNPAGAEVRRHNIIRVRGAELIAPAVEPKRRRRRDA